MNNSFKWTIQDNIKETLFERVKNGIKREDIIVDVSNNIFMEIPEISGAIKFLVDSEYIEKVNETEYVITKGYYKWLLGEVKKDVSSKESFNFNISTKLKERFCKDMGIPIKLFKEPYFENRLRLYDKQYNALSKYQSFLELLGKFNSEQEYFEVYNKLKDDIINYLGSSEAMERFKNEDMNKFAVKNQNYPRRDIFKETNDNRVFISIDMKKANFTALRHYDSSIVGDNEIYEEFVGMFTEYEHFKESKYIRQVVFGNQSPKRQVTYEKYLMDKVLGDVLDFVLPDKIVSFSNDEVVIDITDYQEAYRNGLIKEIIPCIVERHGYFGIKLKQENFLLRKIPGSSGYVKKFLDSDEYEFKCLDALEMPFVLRAYAGEPVREEDKVFYQEGRLAKLIEYPNIEIV